MLLGKSVKTTREFIVDILQLTPLILNCEFPSNPDFIGVR